MKKILGSRRVRPTRAAFGSDDLAPLQRRHLPRCAVPFVAAALLSGCSGSRSQSAAIPVRDSPASVSTILDRSDAPLATTAIAHNAWQLLAPMPTPRFGSAAGVVGNKAFVVGGYSKSGIVGVNEAYDSATKKWSTGLRPMKTPRWGFAAASIGNILYTFGGATSSDVSTNIVEAYNTSNNTWKTESSMPTATNSNSATVYDGYIYVVGGYNSSTGRLSIVQRYDPKTNLLKTAGLETTKVAKSGLGLGTTDDQIVAAEGLAISGATTDTESYSPAKNVWSTLRASPHADFNVCSGAIAGVLYVAGGRTGGAAGGPALAHLDIYHAPTKTWTAGAAMRDPVILPASAVLNGMLMCVGGSNSSFPGGSYYDYAQAYDP